MAKSKPRRKAPTRATPTKATPTKAVKRSKATTATPKQPSPPVRSTPSKTGKRATPAPRGRSLPPRGTSKPKKSPPASSAAGTSPRVPSGARSARTRSRAGTTQKAQKVRKPVAPKAKAPAKKAAPAKRPAVKPAAKRPARPAQKAKPRLSRSKAAIRARKRRADEKAIEEQKKAQRAERARARREKKAGKVDERTLAIGWLEHIRNDFAAIVSTSLEITEPEAAAKTPWLVVGRFDFLDEVSYETLAEMLQYVADDLILEAMIHPQRLSQIRIVYADPNSKRGEGDSIVSKIGAWEAILGDLIGEIIGSGIDEGGDLDEGALAARYAETTIPLLYVYFSSEITGYRTVGPWQTTQTIKLKK